MVKVSIKYYLHTSRGSKGDLPIYLRITYNRKKAELHTGYTCSLKEWSQEEQQSKKNNIINENLAAKKSKIYELLRQLESKNKLVSATILKDLLTGKGKIQVGLLAYFGTHIEEIRIKKEIKAISINKYVQSLNSLKKFIFDHYKAQEINIDQLDYDFINQYGLFLKKEFDLHKNTINKYHSRLRTILLKALAEGHLYKQPYTSFKLVTAKTDREFLSQEELNQIIVLDISHNESLDRVKELFLFSVFTGLRFQDAQNLTIENLTSYKENPSIRFVQEKTGRSVEIPLLEDASRIIEKYNSTPERRIFKKLLPKISNQKLNTYLKIIGDLAGLKRKVTHHIARHTFATTICLNNKMPLEDLSMLLGHSSIKTTQIYGKITQERLFQSMNKIKSNNL